MLWWNGYLRCLSEILLLHRLSIDTQRQIQPGLNSTTCFTDEFSSLSISGGDKKPGPEQRVTQRLVWKQDFWFCLDRFGKRGKTFPVNTIARMDPHSLFPSSNRNLYCALSWALEKLSNSTHLWHKSVGRKKKKKATMPSVFPPSFLLWLQFPAVILSHRLVNIKSHYLACLRTLFVIQGGWGDDVTARKEKKARLSQSPHLPWSTKEPNFIKFGTVVGINMTEMYARFQNNF